MQSFLKNNSVSKINVYPIEGDPTKYDIEWSPLSTNDMNDAQQMVVLEWGGDFIFGNVRKC